MRNNRSIETAAIAAALVMGVLLFVGVIRLGDTVPAEYRSTSPGFGWSWDFDYEAAMREAGRPGAKPWPWSAKATGNRLLLPLNQPLHYNGLELTYRGMADSGSFRVDVVIQNLDAGFAYPKRFDRHEVESGFILADHRFTLENITARYLRLRALSQ